jgi:hypothetical protein
MTQRDILFLLEPDFLDGDGQAYYCPDCAEMEGVLAYFPKLRAVLDVRYSGYSRPRPEVISFVGEDNQNCPVLILSDGVAAERIAGLEVGQHEGRCFISGPSAIGTYLARVHGTSLPR